MRPAAVEPQAVLPLLAQLCSAARRPGRPVLIAIDGPGGAGKSTLARTVRDALADAAVVEGDDFYRPLDDGVREALDARGGYEGYFDWQRLRDEVVEPLTRGEAAAYARYDWTTGTLAGTPISVPAAATVVVEGVYVLPPELRTSFDVAVWVETPRDECARRLLTRGDSPAWIARWRAAEDWYAESIRPWLVADVVVTGVRSEVR